MSRRRTIQLVGSVQNQYQGSQKRVLCVCASGMLRSPTMANVLHKQYGFNTRAVGYDYFIALIPFEAIQHFWADKIVFADAESYHAVKGILADEVGNDVEIMKGFYDKSLILRIPDIYEYMEEDLVTEIRFQYSEATGAKYEPQST